MLNNRYETPDDGKTVYFNMTSGGKERVGNISLKSYKEFEKRALVFGAGGFIGSHMVKRLKKEGYWVRGVDLKYPEFSDTEADDFIIGDLRMRNVVDDVIEEYFNELYQFAADMGGAGYIFTGENDFYIMHNSALINLNTVEICYLKKIKKIFYSSSACMYPAYNQVSTKNPKLTEDSAYPAAPDSEYGWEKLFSERLYLAYMRNTGQQVRIARFHNIFGPEGTWDGGKEKAPAAICRKVIKAKSGDSIDIWGDGEQTRSFLYIDECIEGVRRLMNSDIIEPVNIGSEEMISINNLVKMVVDISKKKLKIQHISGPQGVRGRTSDNALINKLLGWKPKNTLKEGMEKLYDWISRQIEQCQFNLIIQYFHDKNPERHNEYDECVRKNLESPLIKKIYNIEEPGQLLPDEFLNHPKMVNIKGCSKRLTHRWAIEFANKNLKNELVAISNLDIIFDHTAHKWISLRRFFDYHPEVQKLIAFSRHETNMEGKVWIDKEAMCGSSQDVWMFKTPFIVKGDYDFCVGNAPQAESIIARNFVNEGVIVANMGLKWRVLHLDRVRFRGSHSGGNYIITDTTDKRASEMHQLASKKIRYNSIEEITYTPCPYIDWERYVKYNTEPAEACNIKGEHTHNIPREPVMHVFIRDYMRDFIEKEKQKEEIKNVQIKMPKVVG